MSLLSRFAGAALVVVALASAASAGVNTPQSGWYSGNPLLGPNTLRDISCAGPTCYAAGDFGTLLKSKDSGATWTGIVTGLTLDLNRVRLAGGAADRVVVGGGCAVRRSNDGGETFFRLPFTARDTGCTDGVASFSFPTSNTGYLLLASGRLLSTADGGRTFTRRTPVPVSQGLDILCTAERTCLAIGTTGGIQRTEDGGVSWTQVANVGRLDTLGQADSQTLYATGIFRMLLKSTDGGATWDRKPDLPAANLRRIACGDALHCLIAMEVGTQLLRTTDGGDTFTSVVPSSDTTFAVGFAGPTRAIAAGALGSAEVSDDAGVTWSAIGTRIAGSFGVLTAAWESVAYAGGANGVLARTADAGQTWSNVSPPTDAIVTGLAGVGPDRLYVLASDGTLQRSDNGGGSYSLLNPGPVRPYAILALDTNRLILVSQRGLARSVNGGESFESVGGGVVRGALLTAADFASGAVVAYGPRAAVISTDAGTRWRRIKLPRKRSVADLDFATARIGYALDTRRALWRTVNGGKAWRRLLALGTNEGYAIDFSGPRTGYVAIRTFGRLRGRGFLLRTTDGGRSWHPQLVSQSLVRAVESSGATDYALAGESSLFATKVGGDVGDPRRLTLTTRPRSLRRPGSVVVSGRLSPATGGEEVVVSLFVKGRWVYRVLNVAANGTFSTRWQLNRDVVLVAQVLGDADHVGVGTPGLTVRVR
jgi:photosystem II stability/assembly factor-like uncharacterized protein